LALQKRPQPFAVGVFRVFSCANFGANAESMRDFVSASKSHEN
jgi:hypothetical protein